ncbi:MAG: phosphoribosyltransferase regulatory subunit [Acidobacteriota bacterium]|jgi:ATP phosphoribosyltransferase regulatory subunit|nr:phosphoribosyltransferase regulatory subunit [Acidobacteriota bacterium]
MRISADLPTGVAALLFGAARERREMEARLVRELEGSGYAEVILPVLDYAEPYDSFLTAASRGELYRFVDRDGQLLVLRSDFTPMLARLLAPRLASLDLPLRLFYRGDVVRYQEERAGRLREFYQLGAELLCREGEDTGAADHEALRLFLRLLLQGTAGPVEVVLSFAGALDELLLGAAGAEGPARLATAVARRERGVARRASAALLEVVDAGVPKDYAALGPAAAARLAGLVALRDDVAAEFPEARLTIDLAEFAHQALHPELLEAVGERAYYDGLVFHAHAGPAGVAVGGGGRYDRLFRGLGAPVSAVGFSLGLDRLLAPGSARVAAPVLEIPEIPEIAEVAP